MREKGKIECVNKIARKIEEGMGRKGTVFSKRHERRRELRKYIKNK